ncbi:MAG: hypothetical protein K1W26_09275 [Acetatifactor sp.]
MYIKNDGESLSAISEMGKNGCNPLEKILLEKLKEAEDAVRDDRGWLNIAELKALAVQWMI